MAPVVTITDVAYVAEPDGALPPEPVIKLNAMEAQWVVIPLLQHLLLFEGDHLPPFDAILQSLRSSLAATLATHAPLAGKLHYLADTGDVAICRSTGGGDDDRGVRFVAAECDADARRLAGDEDHDVLTFERLVPELDMSLLPAPVLAVQATRLAGGGVALGVSVHHGVADGRSLWRFVEAWAAASRGDTPPAPPVFDRSRVSLPGGEELARSILRKYAPDLPVASMPASLQEDRLRFTRRTFTLDTQDMKRLKQRIVRLGEAHGAPLRRSPSSFVAVVALAWTCFVRGRALAADDDDVFLFFFADARDRLDPPAGADYFGACLTGCLARLPARELHGEGALAAAASAVQGAMEKMVEDPLGCWPGWEFFRFAGDPTLRLERLMNVSGSSGLRAYDVADFGWGRPRRTENIRMNHDGQLALVRARDGDGVQASVSMLQQKHVDAFKSEFLKLLLG
ncbi:phenolic glucoside malonyltransferase 2-like [Miscanthus floridulus]|uniref:phenolic glucoside malonyltransferase 2-like n=1 Tax=Miscanthus floridulus TaxID=154761 RepID=UPI003457CF9F